MIPSGGIPSAIFAAAAIVAIRVARLALRSALRILRLAPRRLGRELSWLFFLDKVRPADVIPSVGIPSAIIAVAAIVVIRVARLALRSALRILRLARRRLGRELSCLHLDSLRPADVIPLRRIVLAQQTHAARLVAASLALRKALIPHTKRRRALATGEEDQERRERAHQFVAPSRAPIPIHQTSNPMLNA